MSPPETPAELLPCVDFTGPRRTLRVCYAAALLGSASGLIALGVIDTDVVVHGTAVVTPRRETARVQTVRGGRVQEILVNDGDAVHKGQPMVRLDTRPVKAKLDTLVAQEQAAVARVAMLEALAQSRAAVVGTQSKIRQVEGDGVANRLKAAEELIRAREREREIRAWEEEGARRLLEQSALSTKDANTAVINAELAKALAGAARASLDDLITSRRRLGLEQQLLQHDSVVTGFSDGALLAEARAEQVRLKGEIVSAEVELGQMEITAPRDGLVQGLAVLDRGDVVAAGSFLASVVPANDDLVVKAQVPSDGIAFIWPEQQVRLKLDAYPFQDFGVFRGVVQRITADTTATEPGGRRGPAYEIQIQITSPPRAHGNELLQLRPGMTGQAEFTVRREPILAALLRPLRGTVDSIRR